MAPRHVTVGTWPFSEQPVIRCMEILKKNGNTKEAVEKGINLAETDPNYGVHHIGCGGWQNVAGQLEQDAAIMDGQSLDYGAVTALSGFKSAVSVARAVMEKNRHSILTGSGAASFASAQGFDFFKGLGTSSKQKVSKATFKRNTQEDKQDTLGHDTMGILALCVDTKDLCAGVSSSGAAGKEEGRVGDSALPGCGLYADSVAGAACCTGDGDQILKHCPSYRVVHLMKQGSNPKEACEQTVQEIMNRIGAQAVFELGIVAVDSQGNHGAANLGIASWTDPISGQVYSGFPYTVFTDLMEKPQIICVPPLSGSADS